MKILLISAYDAVSHQKWREGLVHNFPEYDWTTVNLAPRFFSWRTRGNALWLAFGENDIINKDYDLIIATSMTNLAALKGISPKLARIPSIVYFHENQFEYPKSGKEHPEADIQLTSIYTALSADKILFNSAFNKDTFLNGAKKLLKKMPDLVPSGLIELIESKSTVLPVPVDTPAATYEKSEKFSVVWNHRWEFDKSPDRLYPLIKRLINEDIQFHILGQQFRESPIVFDALKADFPELIGKWGYLEEVEYRTTLSESHAVLSTALHDFQGLSIIEGALYGCCPVLPNRLAYPELFENCYLYDSHPNDLDKEAESAAKMILNLKSKFESGQISGKTYISGISWKDLKPLYDSAIKNTVKF